MRRDSARNSGGSSLAGSSSRACGDAPVRSISIIVPVLNESSTIDALQDQLDRIDLNAERCEVVFVDGGSTDGTREKVRPRYRVVTQRGRGRGGALNTGAAEAMGEVLFFLHCDSVLPEGALSEVRDVLRTHRVGSFGIRFDRTSPVLLLCQTMSNLRIRLRHLSYGDQGLFIERELFFDAGMFPDVPLMEDYQFAMNLRKHGEPLGMARRRIVTSARRFPKGEINRARTWLGMASLRAKYLRGASADELFQAYGSAR